MKDEILAAVEREYAALPVAGVCWDDPHPNGESPRDDEYSNVTEPARYQIVGARAAAWERALTGLGLAILEQADVPAGFQVQDGVASRLVPNASGAASLIVVRREFENTAGTVIDLGVDGSRGVDPVQVATWPDCGCDACDNGSEWLLGEIDDSYLSVVAGGFVYATGGDWAVHTTYDGWSGTGDLPGNIKETFADALAGRPTTGVSTITGHAWWG